MINNLDSRGIHQCTHGNEFMVFIPLSFFQKSFKLHAIDFIDLIDVHVVYARVMSDITQVIPHYIMDLYTEIY